MFGAALGSALAGAAGAAAPPQPAAPSSLEPVSTFLPESTDGGPPGEGARAALAAVPKPGTGGWFWPIGTEDFQGWDSWLQPRGAYLHVAQDMPSSYRHPVYAVGDGVVFISRADAGGYGVGGSNGGCMIITHTTAAGQKFHALYGHVYGLLFKEGERVQAGDVIARVNGCKHLHFSIHPGAKYSDGNPYAGHVPKAWADHGGFVDPVAFLKTNPRTAQFRPPELPRAEIATTSPPLQYGAASGAAYWTEEGGAGTVTYRYDLATRERRALGPGEVVPSFDLDRYDTEQLVAPARGIAVSDHLPALVMTVKHATPTWGAAAQLTATLTNASGTPLRGAFVEFQRRQGERWVETHLGVTDRAGRAALDFTSTERDTLRVLFAPPPDQAVGRRYLAARSAALRVAPHAAVTPPKMPARVHKADQVTVTGYLTPLHAEGANSIDLVFQRRGAGRAWVTKLTADALNRDAGARTRYVGHARLAAAGSWRVQAVHPADEAHAQSYSTWRVFTVE